MLAETITADHLNRPCPSCGGDVYIHVSGFAHEVLPWTNAVGCRTIPERRYERWVCHGCGVTAKSWKLLTHKQALHQHTQGLLTGLAIGSCAGFFVAMVLTFASYAHEPAPAATPTATAQHAPAKEALPRRGVNAR